MIRITNDTKRREVWLDLEIGEELTSFEEKKARRALGFRPQSSRGLLGEHGPQGGFSVEIGNNGRIRTVAIEKGQKTMEQIVTEHAVKAHAVTARRNDEQIMTFAARQADLAARQRELPELKIKRQIRPIRQYDLAGIGIEEDNEFWDAW